MVTRLIACLVFAGLMAPAYSQDPESATPAKPHSTEEERIFRELLEDSARDLSLEDVKNRNIVELVDLVMKVRLTRLLELSDEEAVRIIRVLSDRIDQIHKLKWERGSVYYFLREELKEGAPEADIEKHLVAAMALDVKIAELIRDMIGAMASELSTTQRAKLFLFGSDFEAEIKKLIQQAEEMSAQRRGPVSDKYTRTGQETPSQAVTSPPGEPDNEADRRP